MSISAERLKKINDCEIRNGAYVLYWMQAAQRVQFNHALKFAIEKANEMNLPLITIFCLTENYPSANFRHFKFMLDGLAPIPSELAQIGAGFYALKTLSPPATLAKIAKHAAVAVADTGYTKIQKKWRADLAQNLKIPLYQVESEVIVPLGQASDKEEFSAATLRPKILKRSSEFLSEKFFLPQLRRRIQEYNETKIDKKTPELDILSKSFASVAAKQFLIFESDDEKASCLDLKNALGSLKIDRSVSEAWFCGGYSQAKKALKLFISQKLLLYAKYARNPSENVLSNLSPYLHFGQISALEVAQEVLNSGICADEFLDELIVRRELAANFVNYNPNYDNFSCIPDWAKKSLINHESDKRPYMYSEEELEFAKTHDKYWNACQNEMIKSGKMHSYMRMYWGKKVIEWTRSPEDAYQMLVRLNDKYELDGRDPNGYAGIAWCFGKHDRPWAERKIFGKIRYMNAAGLERKFNMEKYLKRWS